MAEEHLIVRAEDMVVLGVRWSGLRVEHDPADPARPPLLVPTGDDARIAVTFPPQAIAEEKLAENSVVLAQARRAGPSRVAFVLHGRQAIELSAQGILDALLRGELANAAAPAEEATAIELPWRLIASATAPTGVVSRHPAAPIASSAGVVGLWTMSLQARDGTATDAGLALLPLGVGPDDPTLDTSPLSDGHRQAIVHQAGTATVRRLELSALGGSLSAHVATAAFEWDHDATLGRDQRVRVLTTGLLYPFGHRAQLLEVAERIIQPADGPAVAGLRRKTVLTILEPVRAPVTDDPEVARLFPFSEVEICVRTVTDLGSTTFVPYMRVAVPHGELADQLAVVRAQLQEQENALNAEIAAQPASVEAFIAQGFGSSLALAEAQAAASQIDIPALVQQQRDIDRAIDDLLAQLEPTTGPDGELIPVDPGVAASIDAAKQELLGQRPSNQEIEARSIEKASLDAEAARLAGVVAAEFGGQPKTIEALAAVGDPRAQPVLDLRADIAARAAVLQQIADKETHPEDLYLPLVSSTQEPIQFPVRCAGRAGDVHFSVPLIFLKELSYDAEEFFPEFHSFTDPKVADDLAAAWADPQPVSDVPGVRADVPLPAGAQSLIRTVGLPGTPVDLIRSSGLPAPGDIHELQSLGIEAVRHAGSFRPQLREFEVGLPALRSLVPGRLGVTKLAFTDEFAKAGESVDLALKTVDPRGIGVDFLEHPERAGGLVAPKFAADVLSRTLGPIAADALPKVGLPDLASVYDGATLLGFPLGSLIKLDGPDGLPKPPKIVPVLDASGMPEGARMTWPGIPLKSRAPFVAHDATKLDLTVETTTSKATTTCSLSQFDLALPPGPAPLVTLKFGSLVFTQASGHAPDLEIKNLKVDFAGALRLLNKLQAELQSMLDLPDGGPKIRAGRSGLSASYALSVPTVTAGAFQLRDVGISVEVEIPFERKPVTVTLAFASREHPFNLSVLAFGGGGYISLRFAGTELSSLEASLEFGAAIAVNFVIARGEVHALGGVHFAKNPDGSLTLDAYLRLGGSLKVLGLVSVSVELRIGLRYEDGTNRLIGHATLVIEVDLTLYSDSVAIDSGDWVLAGSETSDVSGDVPMGLVADDEGADLAAWSAYRKAFA